MRGITFWHGAGIWTSIAAVLVHASTIPNLDPRPLVRCNEHDTLPNTCQNFARFNIGKINIQVRKDLNTSYTFMAMAKYFSRDDVSYRGFSKLFGHLGDEEQEQAQKMMDYLNKRGGLLHLKPINDPKSEWQSPLEAVRDAVDLMKDTQDSLLDLHWSAAAKNDPHLQHFLETERIAYQSDTIKTLSDYWTLLNRMKPDPTGAHLFDQHLYDGTR